MNAKKQQTFHDEKLGQLVFKARYDSGEACYTTTMPFLSEAEIRIEIIAKSDSESDLKHVLRLCHDLVGKEATLAAKLSKFLRTSVRKSLNSIDVFHSRKLSEEQVEESWKLDAVYVDNDGEVRVIYEPVQSLQFDHGLQINMDLKGNILDHEFFG